MDTETLRKANRLQDDIHNIEYILKDVEKHRWIKVVSSVKSDLCFSVRFQEELTEWLKDRLQEYQEELADL